MASSGASGHNTGTASSSRLLQKKWDDMKLQAHRDRLRHVKSSIDNRSPRNFVHIKNNLGKQQLKEDERNNIQRLNAELLQRMHQIMSTTGRVDHRNIDWKPKQSLNFVRRSQELQRITMGNQTLLRRIQLARPQYSLRSMERDFRMHTQRTRSISLFPPIS